MSIAFQGSPDVVDYYKLLELKLWEYSSVTWGANSLTEIVAVKAGDRVARQDEEFFDSIKAAEEEQSSLMDEDEAADRPQRFCWRQGSQVVSF